MQSSARTLLICGIVVMASGAAVAQSGDPPFPAGVDPGGIAIAIAAAGVTYTDPAIARCLARDGEGNPIAADFADGDGRPWPRHTTQLPVNEARDVDVVLREVPCHAGVRIIPIRVDPRRPVSIGQAVAFAAKTPARILVMPLWSGDMRQWLAFGSAANSFKDLLIIAPSGDDGRDIDANPSYPAAFARETANTPALPNLLVVSAATGDAKALRHTTSFGPKTVSLTVVEDAGDNPAHLRHADTTSPSVRVAIDLAWTLACSLKASESGMPAEQLKQKAMALARPTPSGDGHRLVDIGCRKR